MNNIDNRGRATGKTVRLIYESYINNVPILCKDNHHKKSILSISKMIKIKIPKPITIHELINRKYKRISKEIYCDEMEYIFPELISQISGLDLTKSTMCVPFEE